MPPTKNIQEHEQHYKDRLRRIQPNHIWIIQKKLLYKDMPRKGTALHNFFEELTHFELFTSIVIVFYPKEIFKISTARI